MTVARFNDYLQLYQHATSTEMHQLAIFQLPHILAALLNWR
jgi:hypothetical protein